MTAFPPSVKHTRNLFTRVKVSPPARRVEFFAIVASDGMEFRNVLNYLLSLGILFSLLAYVPFAYDLFVKFSIAIVAVKLAEWLMQSTRKFILFKTVDPKNKAVFITGCDSGFGHQVAKRMDALGYKVYAGCLFPKGEGAKELLNSCSSNLQVLPLDVTDSNCIDEAKKIIEEDLKDKVLWAIVNNAGVPQAGEIDWTPFDELQKVYDINTAGPLRIIKAFLPLIKKFKGRIINNTSICGRFICPGYVGYCMSKSAMVALTTGLRIELAKWGVKVISIEPFFYATPLTTATSDLIDKMWEKLPKETKEDYGEYYKNYFKENSVKFLRGRNNPNIFEVIDCFEDAITAEEPLSTYFPSNLKDKLGIKFLLTLSNSVSENYQRSYIDKEVKPAGLMHEKSLSK